MPKEFHKRFQSLIADSNIEAAYRTLFNFTSEAIFIHKNGVIKDINETAEKMFGYSREELIEKHVSKIIPVEESKPTINKYSTSQELESYLAKGQTKDGNIVSVEIRSIPINGLKENYRLAAVKNITEEKNAKFAINSTTKKLVKIKEEAFQQARKYETLFNISFNAYLIHQDGKIIEMNDRFAEIYGYTKEEAQHINIYKDIFPNEEDLKKYFEVIKGKKRSYYIGKQKKKDGTLFEAEIIAESIELYGKKVRFVTIKDVTKSVESKRSLKEKNQELKERNRELEIIRQELISSRNSFTDFVQENKLNLTDNDIDKIIVYGRWQYDFQKAVFIWDQETKKLLGNDKAKDVWTFEEFIEKVHPDNREALTHEYYNPDKKNKLIKHEFRFTGTDGKERYVVAQGVANYNEENKRRDVYGTVLDITDRKQIEDRLKRQKDHYLKLNEDLIISRKKAEDSEKLKTAFFSNMSHEIRTPMNGILGFSNLLLEPNLSDNDRLEYAQIIADSGKRLLNIVNDILDISKLESDTVKIAKAETNINYLLKTLYSLFSQEKKIHDNEISLHLHASLSDKDSIIYTDQNRLNQILTNLLSNAFKFTEKGKISFGYHVAGSALNFYVEDSGIGIPHDMKGVIFEPFRQVEGKLVREYGGTGLGLSISKKLTNLLGGKMSLESEENKGSRFEFTLPFNRPRVKLPSKIKSKQTQNSIKYNIKDICLLIAEDDEVNFLFYKSFLGSRLKLIRAKDGQEAINIAKHDSSIDIILMDVKMPQISGYEAMREIRKFKPDIPIIVQTAYAMPDDKQKALDNGADDYISKPINRQHLLEKIKKLCIKK